MTRAETLIPFLAAMVALLGYIAWTVRRVSKAFVWFRRLPREHEWLMAQTKTNTDQIKNLSEIIKTLIEDTKQPGSR